jgi:hypothetical protein
MPTNEAVRVFGNKQLLGSANGHKSLAEQIGEASLEHRPQVSGTGRVKTPKAHIALDEPPLTPAAAPYYSYVISGLSSSDPGKRRIAHKAMQRVGDFERNYKDEVSKSFLRTAWSVVTVSGIKIGESNVELNRGLEHAVNLMKSKISSATQCMNSRIEHYKEIRKMRMEYLEKSKMVRNVPSITTWLASIGVSVAAIYALEREAVNFIANHFPKLGDIRHIIYCVAASLVVGAIIGIKKLINWVLNRKQENVENEFYEKKNEVVALFQKRKSRAEEEFNSKESELVGKHVEKSIELAANVYAKVYVLCEEYYPGYIARDSNYSYYLEVKNSKGENDAYNYLVEVGKREAQRQFANHKFFQDYKFSLSRGARNTEPAQLNENVDLQSDD